MPPDAAPATISVPPHNYCLHFCVHIFSLATASVISTTVPTFSSLRLSRRPRGGRSRRPPSRSPAPLQAQKAARPLDAPIRSWRMLGFSTLTNVDGKTIPL
ncbi:hypothetical protein Zm00014a_042780 [Zea mays]|uniref:Uncharacterized protein n=1 Tax=Zea mays TaxID=4577 RepID=A0A3L6F933_MAIZE|nr:hypothetical protein Zm00014a_042780 [Zea mays]